MPGNFFEIVINMTKKEISCSAIQLETTQLNYHGEETTLW